MNFCDVLHGFRAVRGVGTASFKAKLLQKLTDMRVEVLYELLLELCNIYDALDRDQCMEILLGYSIGPRTEHILQFYWKHLFMVDISGHYYGTPFKGHQGITQVDSLSPTILNMVVGTVICHWVTLVTGEEAGP